MARTTVAENNGRNYEPSTMTPDAVTASQIDVSAHTLDLLTQAKESMLQKRQEYVKAIAEIDALLHRQEGGILLMQTLLDNVEAARSIETD